VKVREERQVGVTSLSLVNGRYYIAVAKLGFEKRVGCGMQGHRSKA